MQRRRHVQRGEVGDRADRGEHVIVGEAWPADRVATMHEAVSDRIRQRATVHEFHDRALGLVRRGCHVQVQPVADLVVRADGDQVQAVRTGIDRQHRHEPSGTQPGLLHSGPVEDPGTSRPFRSSTYAGPPCKR